MKDRMERLREEIELLMNEKDKNRQLSECIQYLEGELSKERARASSAEQTAGRLEIKVKQMINERQQLEKQVQF